MAINNNFIWGGVVAIIILIMVVMSLYGENKKLKLKVSIMKRRSGISEPTKQDMEETTEKELYNDDEDDDDYK